jgi:hypothetical protein
MGTSSRRQPRWPEMRSYPNPIAEQEAGKPTPWDVAHRGGASREAYLRDDGLSSAALDVRATLEAMARQKQRRDADQLELVTTLFRIYSAEDTVMSPCTKAVCPD